MNELFQKLGRELDDRWRARRHHVDALPEVATRLLQEEAIFEQVTAQDLVQWVLRTRELPPQDDLDSRFGQPPLTLYRTSRMSIDALFWLDGTTVIHQHGFSGAFQVLAGSSIHSRYTFAAGEVVNENLVLGDLDRAGLEILRRGDTRAILPGAGLIHALFHLDRPSVTLVARTQQNFGIAPQYEFLAPHIARNPFFVDALARRQVELLTPLHALHPAEEFQRGVLDLLQVSDLGTSLKVLEKVVDLTSAADWRSGVQPLLERARALHGAPVDLFGAVLDERARQGTIISQRQRISDADHRFYMALLLNVPDRESIFRLLREKYPDQDPVDRVLRFATELDFGSGSTESDDGVVILRHLLDGATDTSLWARLHQGDGFALDDLEHNRAAIEEDVRFFRTSPLFRPLIP